MGTSNSDRPSSRYSIALGPDKKHLVETASLPKVMRTPSDKPIGGRAIEDISEDVQKETAELLSLRPLRLDPIVHKKIESLLAFRHSQAEFMLAFREYHKADKGAGLEKSFLNGLLKFLNGRKIKIPSKTLPQLRTALKQDEEWYVIGEINSLNEDTPEVQVIKINQKRFVRQRMLVDLRQLICALGE